MMFFGGLVEYTYLIIIIFAANKFNFFYCLTLLIIRVMTTKLKMRLPQKFAVLVVVVLQRRKKS